jgi:opacity protein-like surface antigen
MKYLKVKCIICTLIIALLFIHSLSSGAQKLEFGIRYNPEFTSLLNNNDNNAGSELDVANNFGYLLTFGAGAIYNFNANIGIGIDVLFSREGQQFKGHFTGNIPDAATYSSVVSTQVSLNNITIVGDYVAKAELNFIKLPIMLSLTTDNTNPIFFTLLVGPQLNFLANVAQEVNGEDLAYPSSNIEPLNLYKPVTIDGVLALGSGYNLTSKLVLSIRFRFDYGFNDVEKKDVMVSYSGAPAKHFYSPERKATHNLTEGLMFSLDYKL